MRKLPFEDEWLEGMRNEDGVQLMECLMKEPRLVSIPYRGCNVLHLAIRHDWYGLVLEIFDPRKLFYTPEASAKGSASSEGVTPVFSKGAGSGSGNEDGISVVDTEGSASAQELSPVCSKVPGSESEKEDGISKVDIEGSASAEGLSPVRSKGYGPVSGGEEGIPVDAEGSDEGGFPVGSKGAGPESRNEDGDSSHALDLTAVTISLLTAKEGNGATSDTTDGYYSSGLDVVAMAEIQCHHAINSALSKFLRNVQNLLGDDHPYKLYTKPLETRWNEDWQELQILEPDYEESDHEDLQVPPESKETLRIYVQRHCSGLEKWIGRHDAPNNTFRGGTMSDSEKESRSEFHTYPLWVRRWMVTAPFLPLSEYIFLECMRRWRFKPEFGYNPYTLDATIMQAFIDAWRGCESEMESRTDVSFFQYIMRITDTRRTAFHYGLIGGLRWNIENDVRDLGSPFLMLYSKVSDNGDYGKWAHQYDPYRQNSALEENILREFEVLFNMRDGSGRTLLHILLTSDLEIPPLESRCWGLERNLYIWGRLYPRFDWSVPWLYKWDNWSFKNEVWRRNVQCVYEGYGFQGLESWIPWWRSGKCLPLSADMIVMTSAHLSDSERSARLLWLLDRRLLPQFSPTSVVARFQGVTGAVTECVMLSSLQYAVLLGDTASAEVLAKDNRIYDPARIHIESKESPDHTFARIEHETHLSELDPAFFYSESSLHVAAKHADPEMLRIILDTGKFNPHYDEGNTILHSAVRCHLESPPVPQVMLQDFVEIPKIHTHLLSNLSVAADGKDGTTEDADKRPCQCTKRMEQQREKALDMESGRQGCVNYLLQVGLDVWETDQYNRIADPGPQASRGYKTWWYDKLAQETQDQKANFGAAANALSVTAALVATASYVGPLQPPLGLNFVDNDQNLKVLVDILPVRIFIVCNNLAFFFALVAIVLSLTPSLPMPKEPMLEELKRMRRSITLALIALIMSINTILMAFASAIIAVIPNKGSWNHGWLSMGTLVVGGPICLFVLLLCCIRAVRLLFHNNFVVRRFYKRTVFI